MKKKQGKTAPLSYRQQQFVKYYAGNGAEAAKLAGYAGDNVALSKMSHRLMKLPKIKHAIRMRDSKVAKANVATRLDRQEFWTKVLLDENAEMKDRLKASELLGRSEADFTDNVKTTEPRTQIAIIRPNVAEKIEGSGMVYEINRPKSLESSK